MQKMKKLMAMAVAGAFLAGGTGGFLCSDLAQKVYAQPQQHEMQLPPPPPEGRGRGPHRHSEMRPEMTPREMAERVSKTFSLNEAEILDAHNDGVDNRDIIHAAFVAKASGKAFKTVMNLKGKDNFWRDVEEKLGVTPEKIREVRDEVLTMKMAEKLAMDKDKLLALVKDGYHPHDIAFASVISKLANTDIDTILGEKKINNTWRSVALAHNVSDTALHQGMRDIGGPGMGFMSFGHRRQRPEFGGPGMPPSPSEG